MGRPPNCGAWSIGVRIADRRGRHRQPGASGTSIRLNRMDVPDTPNSYGMVAGLYTAEDDPPPPKVYSTSSRSSN